MDSIFPKNADIFQIKAKTYKGEFCSIYKVGGDPLLFETENNELFPTVYLLWNTSFLKCVGTPSPVLSKLQNGADLMVPGMFVPEGTHFQKNEIVSVCSIEINDSSSYNSLILENL